MVQHQEEAAGVAFLQEFRLAHALELAVVQPFSIGVDDHELPAQIVITVEPVVRLRTNGMGGYKSIRSNNGTAYG